MNTVLTEIEDTIPSEVVTVVITGASRNSNLSGLQIYRNLVFLKRGKLLKVITNLNQ